MELGGIDLAQGRAADGLVHAEDCIQRDMFREDAHRLAIQAYVALGRRAEALKHYKGFAERLKQDLNTGPEAATVQVYERARLDASAGTEPQVGSPAKPSIAVLPFANLSNDPEQDYFADGMVDEIITALSRIHWLFVIARNSSFTYKGRAVDVKQVGRDLDVRYVLEGSVRKAGNRVRIGGQLIDTETGAAIWADRIEGELQDIFDLQDKVTAKVVGAIAPKLERAEIERSSASRPAASTLMTTTFADCRRCTNGRAKEMRRRSRISIGRSNSIPNLHQRTEWQPAAIRNARPVAGLLTGRLRSSRLSGSRAGL